MSVFTIVRQDDAPVVPPVEGPTPPTDVPADEPTTPTATPANG